MRHFRHPFTSLAAAFSIMGTTTGIVAVMLFVGLNSNNFIARNRQALALDRHWGNRLEHLAHDGQ